MFVFKDDYVRSVDDPQGSEESKYFILLFGV